MTNKKTIIQDQLNLTHKATMILDQLQANSGTHKTTHIQGQLNMTHKATVLDQDLLFQDNLRIHKTTTIQEAPIQDQLNITCQATENQEMANQIHKATMGKAKAYQTWVCSLAGGSANDIAKQYEQTTSG